MVNFSDPVRRQLDMYALAASATGVGLLALSSPVEAKIIYTPAHVKLALGERYGVDLDHDGITDFNLYRDIDEGVSFLCALAVGAWDTESHWIEPTQASR